MARARKQSRIFRPSRRGVGVIVVLVLLIIGSLWVIRPWDQNLPVRSVSDGSAINLSPPTEEEKNEAEAHKDELTKRESSEEADNPSPVTQTATGKKQVTPIITQADADSIRSYVNGVFEEGGTCTAKFIRIGSSQTITRTSQGFENASYTSCEPIIPNLSPGVWSVVVSYSSSTAEGESNATEFEVK